MKKVKMSIICLGVIMVFALISTLIMQPLIEDPPSVLSSPVYSNNIC